MSAVAVEVRDDVAILTLTAAHKRNALSRHVLADLREALSSAVDGGVQAVVLTGAGPVFSAGADVAELTGTVEDLAVDAAIGDATAALRACPVLVVAAVEGACVGAAVDLALACDVRIVAEDAFFAVPAVALGILYNPQALARMAGCASVQTLARLLLAGERIAGHDAVVAGLAARAVPAGATLATALELARGAVGGVPEARAATKQVLAALAGGTFDAAAWEDARRALLGSESRARRVQAARARSAART